jgi:hypothetical protein
MHIKFPVRLILLDLIMLIMLGEAAFEADYYAVLSFLQPTVSSLFGPSMSRSSSVGIATAYGLDIGGFRV